MSKQANLNDVNIIKKAAFELNDTESKVEQIVHELDSIGNNPSFSSISERVIDVKDAFIDLETDIKKVAPSMAGVLCRYALRREQEIVTESKKDTGKFEFERVISKYNGTDEEVIIPDGVVGIQDRAFQNNEMIKTVILPSTLEYIGVQAFEGCTNLKRIEFQKGLFQNCAVKIEELAFASTAIDRIKLPWLNYMGLRVFDGCFKLKWIEIEGYGNIEEQDLSEFVECFKLLDCCGCLDFSKWFDTGNRFDLSDTVLDLTNIDIPKIDLSKCRCSSPRETLVSSPVKINFGHPKSISAFSIIEHVEKKKKWKKSIFYICPECGERTALNKLKRKKHHRKECPKCGRWLD